MEFWKKSFCSDRYEISSNGRVFDLKMNKELIPHKNTGYKRVAFRVGGIQKNFYVHRIIAFAFLENTDPVNKKNINHIDGNKLNNEISNLEWCTQKENVLHAHRIGLSVNVKGEKANSAKLTNVMVLKIVSEYKNKNQKELMVKYKLSKATINNILSGRSWSQISGIKETMLKR